MQSMVCTKCEQEKDVSCFSPARNKKRGYQTHCKACRTAYNKAHYKKNKSKYFESRDRTNKKILEEYRAFKESNPCVDCGKKYHYYIMEFDHTENNKANDVARLLRAGRKKLWAEIEKCDLVCCLCHRHRTHKRRTVV